MVLGLVLREAHSLVTTAVHLSVASSRGLMLRMHGTILHAVIGRLTFFLAQQRYAQDRYYRKSNEKLLHDLPPFLLSFLFLQTLSLLQTLFLETSLQPGRHQRRNRLCAFRVIGQKHLQQPGTLAGTCGLQFPAPTSYGTLQRLMQYR